MINEENINAARLMLKLGALKESDLYHLFGNEPGVDLVDRHSVYGMQVRLNELTLRRRGIIVAQGDKAMPREKTFDLAWKQREPKHQDTWDRVQEMVDEVNADRDEKKVAEPAIYMGKDAKAAFMSDMKRRFGDQLEPHSQVRLAGVPASVDTSIDDDGILVVAVPFVTGIFGVLIGRATGWIYRYLRMDGEDTPA